MPRKRKLAAPKKRRTYPRVHHKKSQEGFIEEASITTTSKSITSPVVIPLLFLVGLSLLVFYVAKINRESKPTLPNTQAKVTQNNPTSPKKTIPSLKQEATAEPQLTARGIYAVDEKTNTVLLNKNEGDPLLPASTTKMATALVGLSAFKLDDVLTITKTNVLGQTMGLRAGEKITFGELLHGLLIYSANDAAENIAANYPGGRKAFVDQMNKLAEEQGLTKTHFTNPVGFDEYLHFSTPRDMAKLAEVGLKNEKFAKIVATKEYSAKNTDGTIIHPLLNTNQLLGTVDGVIGVKTGHTTTSGESLVTLVDRDGHRVLIAVLGSTDRFGETKKVIDWIYNNYSWPE